MTGNATIFIVAGIIIISSIVFFNIEAASTSIVSNFDNYYAGQVARNIAQSGVNMAIRQIATNSAWRTGFPLMDLLSGKGSVTAFDTSLAGRPVIAVRGTGTAQYGTPQAVTATSTAYVLRLMPPPPLLALVTTNGPTSTGGGMILDGRDHTSSGTLIPNQGTYAIFSTSSFAQGGSSMCGGTVSGTDYAPDTWPTDSKVIQQYWPYPGVYPTTPDSVFGGPSYGYPGGTLKFIAQEGLGGSQYVTDPSLLSWPISGITYVEPPSGFAWSPKDVSGTGVLVVHNSAKNALITNVNKGSFVGILISDDVAHISSSVTGGIITLSTNPSQGTFMGTSNGNWLYSRQAINDATNFVLTASGWQSTAGVVDWWD